MRGGAIAGVVEHTCRIGQRCEYQAVPCGDTFVVSRRVHPPGARCQQCGANARESCFDIRDRNAESGRKKLQRQRHREHSSPVQVSVCGHRERHFGEARLFTKHGTQFIQRPHVETAFFAFAVGIDACEHAAFRAGHIAQQPVERVAGDTFDFIAACRLHQKHTKPREERIVVQHLLEMRHDPFAISRIAGKATTDLIADSAACHRQKTLRHGSENSLVAVSRAVTEQKVERHCLRKLRCAAESVVIAVIEAEERIRSRNTGLWRHVR